MTDTQSQPSPPLIQHTERPVTLREANEGFLGSRRLQGVTEDWRGRQDQMLEAFRDWAEGSGLYCLQEIRGADLDRYLIYLMDSGLSRTTARCRGMIIRAMARHAIRTGLVYHAPLASATLPPAERPAIEVPRLAQLLSTAQVAALPAFHAFFLLALGSGLRRGEVLNLRWRDVEWERGAVLIRCRRSWMTKTRKDRAVGVAPWALEALKALQQATVSEGRPGPFLDAKEKPLWWGSAISKAWRKLADAHGLPKVRLHDLRHAHATELLARGANLRELQEQLGHSRVTTTEIYAHLDTATARRLGRMLA